MRLTLTKSNLTLGIIVVTAAFLISSTAWMTTITTTTLPAAFATTDPTIDDFHAIPTAGTAPLTVSFTSSVSGGVPPYTYSWDFDDGSGTSTQGPSVQHTYQAAGIYTARLTVTDVVGAETFATVTVIANSPPIPSCSGPAATIVGTSGNDNIIGTPGDDIISGLGGDDTITGLGGDDAICGDDGSDKVTGGSGNDIVDGGNVDSSGDSDDVVDGGSGNDRMFGHFGNDQMKGGSGNDFMNGQQGDDRLTGGSGSDFAEGLDGRDTCDAETEINCEA